jgi:hypothetical protein
MSLAVKYAMKKRMAKGGMAMCAHGGDPSGCEMCMADGGEVAQDPGPPVDPDKAKKAEESMRKAFGYADGDMVERAMQKRMAESGEEEPVADFEDNDFDRMDQIGEEHDADYSGANSGDEDGNAALDEDEDDLVMRAMMKRHKDKNPRPA